MGSHLNIFGSGHCAWLLSSALGALIGVLVGAMLRSRTRLVEGYSGGVDEANLSFLVENTDTMDISHLSLARYRELVDALIEERIGRGVSIASFEQRLNALDDGQGGGKLGTQGEVTTKLAQVHTALFGEWWNGKLSKPPTMATKDQWDKFTCSS